MTDRREGVPRGRPIRPVGAVDVPPRRQTPLYRALSRWLLRIEARVRARGSRRIRLLTRIGWGVVAALGLLLLFGPVINKPLGFDDIVSSSSTATESWVARSFDADFTVDRDGDGRMRLLVHETIDVHFPDGVSSDHVERVIASQYEGHDLAPEVTAARLDGVDVTADVRRSATRTTIEVGDGRVLDGDHVVEIEYVLHDVVYSALDESTRLTDEVLEWNVFGPDWPHAVASSRASITVPADLVDAYSRQPSGGIAWLLASGSTLMTPDRTTADGAVYVLENDQNVPPHAQFWFTFRFAPGTFVLPPPSALFWVQAVGPFVPLALLTTTLLLALAARAVAWADARGRAWYVSQSEPPPRIAAPLAARLVRSVLVAPLVGASAGYQAAPDDPARVRDLVRESRRTGRWGHTAAAWTVYLRGAWHEQFRRSLRRVPRGFVRDSFLGAALALTFVQWGLARQLSYQSALSVYWWPIAVVAVSTLLGGLILTITLTARPLTREGALVREHLWGMRLYFDTTTASERITLRDPLLPYLFALSPARRARATARRVVADGGLDAAAHADPDYVGPGRFAVRAIAVLSVAAAIAATIWLPLERPLRDRGDAAYGNVDVDLPGDYGVFVRSFEAEGVVAESSDGLALAVTERIDAVVGSNLRDVPQVLRQWVDHDSGHDQKLTVTDVTVDGRPVPFTQSREQGMALLQTQIPDEWPGEHMIRITYELADPVVTVDDSGDERDQLRWIALNTGWEFGWRSADVETQSASVELRMPQSVAERLIGNSGWLPAEFRPQNATRPFAMSEEGDVEVVMRDELELDAEGRWVDGRQYHDLGAQLQFPSATYTSGDLGEWFWYHVRSAVLPLGIPLLFGALALAIAVTGGVIALRRPERLRGGVARDVVRWLPSGLTAGQVLILFGGAAGLAADDARLAAVAWVSAASAVATVWTLWLTRRRRIPSDDG